MLKMVGIDDNFHQDLNRLWGPPFSRPKSCIYTSKLSIESEPFWTISFLGCVWPTGKLGLPFQHEYLDPQVKS